MAGVFKDSLATYKHGNRLGHQLEHSYPSWQTSGDAGSAFCRRGWLRVPSTAIPNMALPDSVIRLQKTLGSCGPDVFAQEAELEGAQGRYGHGTGSDKRRDKVERALLSQMQLERIFQESSYVISKNLERISTQRHSISWTFHN